ncbi:6,7-dimethyl-8-ribityllumazine synthase [candidate division WOR-3 bacterium]|nr:6,7-dimethyl-8-ribityllumazine synthase [candidate division WOR-3 bacterium]
MKIHEGKLSGVDRRFAIVLSRFNNIISDRLLLGAVDCLVRHQTEDTDIEVFKVPGAYEIPMVAGRIAKEGKFDAVICLGAVIRGETPHFEFIASSLSRGIMELNLTHDVPVIMGIITADALEQATERAGGKQGNRGFDAALTALEIVNLKE